MSSTHAPRIATALGDSVLFTPLLRLLQKIGRRISLARTRRQLMKMDDRLLDDIGLVRSDIQGNFWKIDRSKQIANN
jgi:uncharacterized protein YjiS (DUF1127 family)